MAHDAKATQEVVAKTPDVKTSKPIMIIIVISIALFILLTLKGLSSSESTTDAYDFSETKYDSYFVLEIKPNEKVRVDLTNDYCPIESSSKISVYNQDGYKRILEGFVWIKGAAMTNSLVYTFKNESSKNVTIKIGRFLDEAAYVDYLKKHKKNKQFKI